MKNLSNLSIETLKSLEEEIQNTAGVRKLKKFKDIHIPQTAVSSTKYRKNKRNNVRRKQKYGTFEEGDL